MKLSPLVPLLIFLPNIILIIAPPTNESLPDKYVRSILSRIIEVIEWISKVTILVLPFYCALYVRTGIEFACLGLMLLAMIFYYIGWIRYILNGRDYRLLFTAHLGIPLPMAVWPSIYFLLSSVILHSPMMTLVALLFGVTHIYIGAIDLKRFSN
jgi:hypothetical protein